MFHAHVDILKYPQDHRSQDSPDALPSYTPNEWVIPICRYPDLTVTRTLKKDEYRWPDGIIFNPATL